MLRRGGQPDGVFWGANLSNYVVNHLPTNIDYSRPGLAGWFNAVTDQVRGLTGMSGVMAGVALITPLTD